MKLISLAAGSARLTPPLGRGARFLVVLFPLLVSNCSRHTFPAVSPNFREFGYVANSGGGTVSVLDLVYLRTDRTLTVGQTPIAVAANPIRKEVYVVNQGSASLSVIDAGSNTVVATVAVRRQPSAIAVAPDGRTAFVTNSGSNSVSTIDLIARREVAVVDSGAVPVAIALTPDSRSLVVANREAGSLSIFSADTNVQTISQSHLLLRTTMGGCPGVSAVRTLPDSSKVFAACSSSHQVMVVSLAAAPNSWSARQNSTLLHDNVLSFLDVGRRPTALTVKPDGGEIFVSNSGSDSISEIATWPNEVGGTYTIASQPGDTLASSDNGTLWIANFAADTVGIYSIDDGRLVGSVRTGSAPVALAFSSDEHLLLAANAHSGDVAVIRTDGKQGPALFTMLPAGSQPAAVATKAFTLK